MVSPTYLLKYPCYGQPRRSARLISVVGTGQRVLETLLVHTHIRNLIISSVDCSTSGLEAIIYKNRFEFAQQHLTK
jgi:hypothetical protein